MGLDDFMAGGDGGSHNNKDASSSSHSSGGIRRASKIWVTDLDFSKPYVIVARDRKGKIYTSKEQMLVIKEADDWRRLDESPHRDMEVLFKKQSKQEWLHFCNLVQDQLGEDPNKVLEDEPKRLVEFEDKIYYPPGKKPSETAECQVCGALSSDEGVTMGQLKLEKHLRLNVCASHTVEELLLNGFGQ